MPFGKFTLYTFLGCLPWTFALTWAGYALGNNWEAVLRYGEPVSWVFAVAFVAVIAWWLGKRYRARRIAEGKEPSATPRAD
jgi:membrane protein DedA with SNARE-associated domain